MPGGKTTSPRPVSQGQGAPQPQRVPQSQGSSASQGPRRKSSLLGFNFANFSISKESKEVPSWSPLDNVPGIPTVASPGQSRKSSGINGFLRKSSTTQKPVTDSSTSLIMNPKDNRMSVSSGISHRSFQIIRTQQDVVYQGWLMKRGEHIKNWRARYFVLFKDGALLGFKTAVSEYKDPLNDFTVKDVQVS